METLRDNGMGPGVARGTDSITHTTDVSDVTLLNDAVSVAGSKTSDEL